MIGAPFLMLFAAMTQVEATPATGSGEASLGVTATVIRPLDISVQSTGINGPVVTLRNSGSVEVEAAGATLTQRDRETIIAASNGAGSMTITVIY